MDRDEIAEALAAVGAALEQRGLTGDMYVVGGAAFALAYDARRTTRDIDAVFEPKLVIYEIAARVAEERGWPPAWLNDGVKGFLVGPDLRARELATFGALRVQVASPQMLLALKVLAHRPDDADDVRQLAGMLDLRDPPAVLDLVAGIAGPQRLSAQAQFFVEGVLEPT